jgi:DNA-binding XRE family transcriptional regulator
MSYNSKDFRKDLKEQNKNYEKDKEFARMWVDIQKKILLLKDFRKEKNLTQNDLADLLHTSRTAISRIENGNQNISLKMLAKFAYFFDKKVDLNFI